MARLADHDDVIAPLVRGAPRLGLALGPTPARAGPDHVPWRRPANQPVEKPKTGRPTPSVAAGVFKQAVRFLLRNSCNQSLCLVHYESVTSVSRLSADTPTWKTNTLALSVFHPRGAARIFLRGGGEVMEAKALKRKNCLW